MLTPSIQEKLEKYCSNIVKWNKVYNLLSSSQTESEIWQRHILDSTQLFEHIPANSNIIVDYGSGAGFPAIPIAIYLAEKNSEQKIYMFESVNKKANFLEDTARILGLKNTFVKCERIESNKDLKADLITARAFKKIDEIFEISKNFMKADTKFLLLKGKNVEEEIAQAKIKFSFEYQLINSATGDGFIFIAENVKHL